MDDSLFNVAMRQLEDLNRDKGDPNDAKRKLLLEILKNSAELEDNVEKKGTDYTALSIIILNEADLMNNFTPSPRRLADPSIGLQYLNRAIDLGFEEARSMLGTLYAEGRFVKEDETKARSILSHIETAHPQFTYEDVIKYYLDKNDPVKAFHYAEIADKEATCWSGSYYLAYFLLKGLGTKEDPSRAIAILTKLTSKYDIQSGPCRLLAYCYLNGIGTPKDMTKGKAYYEQYEKNKHQHYPDSWYDQFPIDAKDFE